jgi:predicted O-linked N-acetylglucosamine transferase (SPINDLY family)
MHKIGRNDACPCGSGKKYKQCCLRQADAPSVEGAPPPLSSEQLMQLALVQHMAGKLDEAEAVYRDVLKREPRNAAAWHMNGVAAGDRGNFGRAIEYIRKAIALDGNNHSFHANLGRMFTLEERHAEAEQAYRRALALRADRVYHDNLGNALRSQEKYTEAEANYRQAIALDPGFASAQRNLADLLQMCGRHGEALAAYRQALALQPDSPDLYSNIGTLLQAEGDYAAAIDNFRAALERDAGNTCASDNLLYSLSFYDTPRDYLRAARRRGDELITRARDYPLPPEHAPSQRTHAPLRVGFVSGDFRNHPVGIFLENILAHLRGESVELIAYATTPVVDALTTRIRPHFSEWRVLNRASDLDAARQIRSDRIDILVDLSGHTAHNRLGILAWKPAPVQVSWLGYWASTGLATIDYILVDPHSLPPDEVADYVEQPWYLPDTRLCFTPPHDAAGLAPPPALRNGYVTFGCFNNPVKINDAVAALWARILQSLPDSRLLLKAKQFVDPSFADRMRGRFAAHGIDTGRILLQPETPRTAYFAAYNEVDIALDPFPFTGGTTSVDGLWMGVPLITLRGDRMIAHQGESILHNIGMDDWIADDAERYIEIAQARGADLKRLAHLRGELRTRLLHSPLCDAPRFAVHLATAFKTMWQRHIEATRPAAAD